MRPLRATSSEASYYHVTSRALERRAIFDEVAAEKFRGFMRQVEAFTGVKVVTYCIMSNHVHLLLHVPSRREISDDDMLSRFEKNFSPKSFARFRDRWDRLARQGSASGLDDLRHSVLKRMFDLSFFMKELKQRFSTWHNFRTRRQGPVWEGRFRSSLIENKPGYLATAAAYIDLNPMRAGMTKDPKDHRFCGYAEALAGQSAALDGLRALTAPLGSRTDAPWVLETYRLLLFGKGTAPQGHKGIAHGAVQAVFAAQGSLPSWILAAHRLRWLTDGAVIGSKAFVQDFRDRRGPALRLRRKQGAYPTLPESPLCSLRPLRASEDTPPSG